MSASATEYHQPKARGLFPGAFDRRNLRPRLPVVDNEKHPSAPSQPYSQPTSTSRQYREPAVNSASSAVAAASPVTKTNIDTSSSVAAAEYPGHSSTSSSSSASASSSASTSLRSSRLLHGPRRQHHALPVDSQESAPRRATMPDWNEFYKNGLPREIIVIDDTPEPNPDDVYSQSASYHAVPVSQLPPASAIAANSTKRKYDDVSSSQSSYQTAEESGSFLSQSASARNGHLEARSPDVASQTWVELPEPRLKDRRKRPRYEPPLEESEPVHPQPANIEYRGLGGPVRKAKEVAVRLARKHPQSNTKSLDDADGHYVVVPDAYLSSEYQIKRLIGQGTFGKVVLAHDAAKNRSVAVKVIRAVQKYRDAARIELRVLQTLRQNDEKNKYRCIHLQDCFDFHGHICIVTDLLDLSIFDFLKSNGYVPFPNSHIQSFAKQLLTSIAFIHDIGLIHTDLKPENILLCDASYQAFTYNRKIPSCRTCPPRHATQRKVLVNSEIRLIDFGSATFQDEYHSSVVSTRHYRAPEIILGLGWSFPCDIWSIGCILVEFFTGDALFQTHDNLEHLALMEAVFLRRIDPDMVRKVNRMGSRGNGSANFFKRLKLNYPAPETDRGSRRFVKTMKPLKDIIPPANSFLENFIDLLEKMFNYDPAKRITAKQALLHPWFQEVSRDDGTEATKIAMQKARALRNGADQHGSSVH